MRALDDIRVLDLTHVFNGPYATQVLGLLGAEVIKIEPLPYGERARSIFPIPDAEKQSYPFVMLNSNKKGITLNLKSERGKALFKQFVTHSDIVVENFTAGTMDKLGLGYQDLKLINPRIIYASSSGYGKTGPYSAYPAFDSIVQALSGIMSTTGDPAGPPMKAGPPIMDIMAGIHFAAGILAALHQRDRTGEGLEVETSLFESAIGPMTAQISAYRAQGGSYERAGNRAPNRAFSPYNCYPASDGYVLLLTSDNQRWQALCTLMGREDIAQDENFATNRARSKHADEVDEIVSTWTTHQPKHEIMRLCGEADITCGAVQTVEEVLNDPHLRARGILKDIDHPTAGPVTVLGAPWRFNGQQPPNDAPSPNLGEHNELVYSTLLGLSEAEIRQLEADGVI